MQTGTILPGRRQTADHDSLSDGQRRALVAAIVAAHAAAVWALMQVREVRQVVVDVVPVFASLIAPPKPLEPLSPPPVPERRVVAPRVIAAAPSPAPAPLVVTAPPEIAEPPAPPMAVVTAAAPVPAPAPVPPPQPKDIPASQVQYLEPIEIVYPRLSIRQREQGIVLVRLLIDEAGLPRDVRVSRSSGFARLDDAAVSAVRKARFKPPTENGRPVTGITNIPVDFQLEK